MKDKIHLCGAIYIHRQKEKKKCSGQHGRDTVIKTQLNRIGYEVRSILHSEGVESCVAPTSRE